MRASTTSEAHRRVRQTIPTPDQIAAKRVKLQAGGGLRRLPALDPYRPSAYEPCRVETWAVR